MNHYHPQINTAAHSLEWLQNRRDYLARIGLGGTINEKRSTQRKAEMRAIDAGIRARGHRPRQLPRPRPEPAAVPAPGLAHVLPAAPALPTGPLGLCGYSTAVASAQKAYAPKPYSVYA